MALPESKKQYKYTVHTPVIVEHDREQGQGAPVIPGHDPNAGIRADRTADASTDDLMPGDEVTVKGRRTGIFAGTRLGG